MKKIILLLLVLSLLCLPGCKFIKKIGKGADSKVTEVCEIAKESKPTKIITTVAMSTSAGDNLSGYYNTTTDGTNVIFEFYYEKIATPEESLASGDMRRIVPYEGVITYKNGAYSSSDGSEWRPGTGTAFDLKLNFNEDLFKNAAVSEDGKILECKLNAADLAAFIGTDLNATGEVTVKIENNGSNLTAVTVSCATANGEITIRNSYTYNKQDLSTEE